MSPIQYLGGKSRIAKPIAEILVRAGRETGRPVYVEPFLGGGSVAALAVPHFEDAVLADVVPDLVLLWEALLDGWVPPADVTEEEYRALRHAEPSALRAFAGYACSFGGKWFGGYARDPRKGPSFAQTGARSLARKAAGMRGAQIVCADYTTLRPSRDLVVYCDPPYAGTTGYGAAGAFDSGAFWRTAASWADAGAAVFVSEYAAPAGWVAVWNGTPRGSLSRTDKVSTVAEYLFTTPDLAARRDLPKDAS